MQTEFADADSVIKNMLIYSVWSDAAKRSYSRCVALLSFLPRAFTELCVRAVKQLL